MSDIKGQGYGFKHSWARGETAQVGSAPACVKNTRYTCTICGASFEHFYDLTPDIFAAIRAAGVSEGCPHRSEVQKSSPSGEKEEKGTEPPKLVPGPVAALWFTHIFTASERPDPDVIFRGGVAFRGSHPIDLRGADESRKGPAPLGENK